MVFIYGRGGTIRQGDTFISSVVRVAKRCTNAAVGGHTGKYYVPYMSFYQYLIKVGSPESTLTRLVYDYLTFFRVKLGNDVPALLAADKYPSHAAFPADLRSALL